MSISTTEHELSAEYLLGVRHLEFKIVAPKFKIHNSLRLRMPPCAYAYHTCKQPCAYACAYAFACVVRVSDDEATAAKTTMLKNSRFLFSNVVAIIPTCYKCQMEVKYPGVEFVETAPKFRKRKRNSPSCVYFFIKRPSSRAVTAKKCNKKYNARAELLFFLLSLLLF